jgi:hypothetical protein
MMEARFYVVGDHDAWVVKFEDSEYGPYENRDEAMVIAIDAAQKLGMRGESAHVCVLDDDGHFIAITTCDEVHRRL